MRLYGGRQIKSNMQRRIRESQELRDAIVMSVDSTNRYALVKIQGSDTSIKAWYPENWESTPVYLKPGNAVRINLPGGNKSRIEVMGMGMLLPTAVPGGSVTPTPATLTDAVLTGCAIRAANPTAMSVSIDTGTYRIDGTTYTLCGMVMDMSSVIMDRLDLVLDRVGDVVFFDAASATQFRYDTIEAGIDGRAGVVKGSNFSAGGTIPDPSAASADHVAIGFVLIPPNCTAITEFLINKLYTAPIASELSVVVDDDDLAWGETSTHLHTSIKDQFGNYFPNTMTGWYFTFAWVYGNGTLSYGGASQDETADFSFYYAGAGNAEVTYTRDGLDPGDESPTLTVTEALTGLSTGLSIILRNALGEVM